MKNLAFIYTIDPLQKAVMETQHFKGMITPSASTDFKGQPKHGDNYIIGGAHAFLLRVSSFFGLAPLRFKSLKSGYYAVSISRAKCIYGYVLVILLAIGTIFGCTADFNFGIKTTLQSNSTLTLLIQNLDDLIVLVAACVSVLCAPRRMKYMLTFMENIAMVDKSIGAQYSAITERKLYYIIITILISFSAFLFVDFTFYNLDAIKWKREFEAAIYCFAIDFCWYMIVILELQFSFTALLVSARFAAINDLLALTARNMTTSVKKFKPAMNVYAIRVSPAALQRSTNVSLLVDTVTSREPDVIIIKTATGETRFIVPPYDAIRRLASMYETLCDVVNGVNESYGLQLIVLLISMLLNMIMTPYHLIVNIIVLTDRIHDIVMQFIWCIIHVWQIIVIVEPGYYTIAEEKRTKGLVSCVMSSAASTSALSLRLEIFARRLLLQPTGYAPMGICTLSRPLLVSVAGTVITYLVIILQFQL